MSFDLKHNPSGVEKYYPKSFEDMKKRYIYILYIYIYNLVFDA